MTILTNRYESVRRFERQTDAAQPCANLVGFTGAPVNSSASLGQALLKVLLKRSGLSPFLAGALQLLYLVFAHLLIENRSRLQIVASGSSQSLPVAFLPLFSAGDGVGQIINPTKKLPELFVQSSFDFCVPSAIPTQTPSDAIARALPLSAHSLRLSPFGSGAWCCRLRVWSAGIGYKPR